MKTLFTLLAGFALALPLGAQEKATLAGKAWTVAKSEEAPPGTTFQFGADGSLKVTFAVDGKSREIAGTYTLSGTTLTLKLSHDGRERVDVRTIKKLTETALIVEDKNRKVEEMQRK